MIIVDAHVDIAWNALQFGRDYRQPVAVTRQAEHGTPIPAQGGRATLGLPEWLHAGVAVMFATIFVVPARRAESWDTQIYRTPQQAAVLAQKQLDYYQRLCDSSPYFSIIRTRADLAGVLKGWQQPATANTPRQIGLLLLMEGADPIVEPKAVAEWFERGVRMVGPAWAGTQYSGGTGEPGELTRLGSELLAEMDACGMMLDISHQCQRSSLQALARFSGAVCATHANPRAIATPSFAERALADVQIRELAARDGVIGAVLYNRFLQTGWRGALGDPSVTVAHVAAAADHICQLTGSANHIGIGSDFDGGFGADSIPSPLASVADLPLVPAALQPLGYTPAQMQQFASDNWLNFLRRGLPN